MKYLGVAALLALLSVPAHLVPARAQMPNINLLPEVKTMTDEEKEQDAIRQKAYRDSLRQIPDTKASADPWGNVRNDAPKRAAPARQSRAKGRAN